MWQHLVTNTFSFSFQLQSQNCKTNGIFIVSFSTGSWQVPTCDTFMLCCTLFTPLLFCQPLLLHSRTSPFLPHMKPDFTYHQSLTSHTLLVMQAVHVPSDDFSYLQLKIKCQCYTFTPVCSSSSLWVSALVFCTLAPLTQYCQTHFSSENSHLQNTKMFFHLCEISQKIPQYVLLLACHLFKCSEKWDQQYFVHNFNKFKCTVVIFDKQHHESTAKLWVSLQLCIVCLT